MRPLPVTAADHLPAGVLGVSVVRGEPLPVVSLGFLLRQPRGREGRFVVVRTPGRDCVLAVDAVETILSPEATCWHPMPRLLERMEFVEAIASADQDLMVTLDMVRLMAELPPAESGNER